jgi:hypothetical protein
VQECRASDEQEVSVKRVITFAAVVLLALLMLVVGWIAGRTGIGSVVEPASLPELERQFAERMKGASLVGRFTIAGREDQAARPDRYDIESVEKVGENQWRFNAKMSYGDLDATIPIVVPMGFLGDTPVITLTDLEIPGVGTYTARVFFYGDRYAGTWQGGRVGGHMYGRIERPGESSAPSAPNN